MTIVKKYFPHTKQKWRSFYKVFLPIILGSMMFALNGVVDNFMVGHINQGQSALGAMNSWGAILTGFFLGTAAAGSVVMAQFYHAKKLKTVREVSRIRILLSFAVAIALAIVAWTNASQLADVFLSKGTGKEALHNYKIARNEAVKYAHIIAFQWILISLSFNYGNQLRELGHARVTMFWGLGTLATNITLNSILMFGFDMGVEGAAWASVAGRLVAIITGVVYINVKKIPVNLNPFKIFAISKESWIVFLKRIIYFIAIFSGTFFVVFRNYFYSKGFPSNSFGQGVSGMSVIALTGALINVFTVVFNALSAMAANFVGSELGKNNLTLALIYSDELNGFNTLNAYILSIMMVIFAALIPYMSFLSNSAGVDNAEELRQVSHSTFVIAFYFPIWIWFSTSYRNASTGGKGHWFQFTDWFISALQLVWLAIIALIIPHSGIFAEEFAATYSIFFLSDLLKLIVQEILYMKYPWAQNITRAKAIVKKDVAQEAVDIENLHD